MPAGAQTVSDFGGAVQDLFGYFGEKQSAATYRKAAEYSGQNAEYAQEGADLRSFQVNRKAQQQIGGQQSDVAGAGFSASGSALDLLRESTQQQHLAVAASDIQGDIDVNTYRQAQSAYEGQAKSADQQGFADIIGGFFKVAAAVATVVT